LRAIIQREAGIIGKVNHGVKNTDIVCEQKWQAVQGGTHLAFCFNFPPVNFAKNACWGRFPNPHWTPPFGGGWSLRTLPCRAFAPQIARSKTRIKGQDERVAPALDAVPWPRRFAAKERKPHQAFPPAKTINCWKMTSSQWLCCI